VQVSPDHSRLAYAVDTVGGEKFTLHVLDLATGQELLTPTIEVSAMSVQTSLTSRACQLFSVYPPSVLTLFEDGDDGTVVTHMFRNVCTMFDMWLIQDTAGSIVWANDNETLFYVTKDKLDRPYKVRLTGKLYGAVPIPDAKQMAVWRTRPGGSPLQLHV
jgi:protease II